jgi:DNA transposition AAA+ family ATPase
LQNEGVTFKTLSLRCNVSRTTISQYVNQGKTLSPGQEEKIREAVEEFKETMHKIDGEQETIPIYKSEVELYETQEYREAIGWCSYVYSKRKMGVLVGHPGSGKTTVLRNYAQMQPGVVYVEAWHNMRIGDLLETIGRSLGITLRGNSYTKTQAIIAALKGRNDIAIAIDEAEYLCRHNVDKLEIIRKIWDNTGTPIIISGTMVLEDLLTRGKGGSNLAQLYRRKVEIKLRGITPKEAKEILSGYYISDNAAAGLASIAGDVKHGGMGTFVELLDLCLEVAEGRQITNDILASAKRYKLMY